MTKFADIINPFCALYVDDINLARLAEEDPALYYRRMWGYLYAAIPFFNEPSWVQEYLLGTPGQARMTEPLYTGADYTPTYPIDPEHDLVIAAPNDVEYEICTCRAAVKEQYIAEVIYTPIPCSYDAEQGVITIAAADIPLIPDGATLEFDFYKDGYFEKDLSLEMKKILGLCFALCWQMRFNNDWLSNVSKPQDKSFSEQNRANKMRADTERLEVIKRDLAGEIRAFEEGHAIRALKGAEK